MDVRVNFVTSGQEILTGALRQIGGGFVTFAADAVTGAADALQSFAVDSFKGAIEAQRGIDVLTASITRMGDASPITVDSAFAMADALKNLVGGSDDVVLAMQNVGLRFNQIGADVFPRFITQSADLAAALGIDPVKSAELLGKVLQDISIDGAGSIGKLKAAGVQLTEAQEKQILAMVESGNAAEAQKLVLDALAETTGGAASANAESLAGQWAIFQETVADAGEGVALELLPPLTELAKTILPPLTTAVTDIAGALGGFIGALASGDIGQAFDNLGEWDTVRAIFQGLGISVYDLGGTVESFVASAQTNFATFQSTIASVFESFQPVIAAVVELWETKLAPAFATVFGDVTSNAPSMQEIFTAAMDGIKVGAAIVADFMVNTVIPAVAQLVDWFMANWPTIKATGEQVMNGLQTAIQTVLDWVSAFWSEWGDDIMAAADGVWAFITDTFATFEKAFKGDWRGFGEDLRKQWDALWNTIQTIVTDGIDALMALDWKTIGEDIIRGVAGGITSATGFIVEAAKSAANAAFEAAKGFLGIESPSKLFRGIGENMMLGWAQGITSNAGLPAYAVTGAAYATTIHVGGISVSGAGAPAETAAAIVGTIEELAREGFARARLR